ncbi:MAG: hypothetical protein COA88_00605 [Kordia sp.]|nr:MAG: hypothetical protein COA88_00605 [Kordia sp.]
MKKENTYYFDKWLFIIALFFFTITSSGQIYADKNYYLIDSLNLNELSEGDKKTINSSLILYHNATNDTLKLDAIDLMVENLWDEKTWPRYNQLMYSLAVNKLKTLKSSSSKNRQDPVIVYFLKAQIDALNNMGLASSDQGKITKAFEYYNKGLQLSRKIKYKMGIASTTHNLSAWYFKKGDLTRALEYNFMSLKITEEIGYTKGISTTLNNIGILYDNQGDSIKALEYFKKSLKLRKEIGDKNGISHSLHSIGNLYKIQGNFIKALEFYYKSLKIREEIGNKGGIANSLNNIGFVYQEKGEIDKALEHYQKSLKIWNESGFKDDACVALNYIGNIYLIKGNIIKAKHYALRGMKMAQELGFPSRIRDNAEILNKIYKKEKKWKEALRMQELYTTMLDSIRNKETEKDVMRQQAKYDIEKKEQEIKLLSSQNEIQELKLNRNQILITAFSTAFGLALILIVVTYSRYKKKKVINQLLEKQKEAISKKNEEKKAMLKEIHHRVKNNLQVVNSLLKLQSREIEDEKVVNMFKEAQSRVVSMALLHEKMYRSDDLQHIDVKDHISLLITDLVSSYVVGKKIRLDVTIEEVNIGLQTLVPLGLIVNEVITNSLKYAFKSKNEGTITVSLKQISHKNYELIIGDDGIGFIQEKESTGLGRKLIQIFTKQLNGTIEKLNSTGTVYKLVFEKID